MPKPRARSKSPARPSARAESLSAEEMASLAGFDLVESALDEFQPPPELASRRELKAAKAAANAGAKASAKAGARAGTRDASAQTPDQASAGASGVPTHYFSSSPPLKAGQGKSVQLQVAGADIMLQGGAGTFSKSALDQGTQILIEAFAASPAFGPGEEESVAESAARSTAPFWCDMGCGWGAVACVLASLRPQARVLACDINRRAAALALANARALELANVAAWNGDGLSSCPDACFDAILCNPPVRAGNRVIEKLFEDSRRCLKHGGEMWIVLRTAQGAKSWQKKLAGQFNSCDTIEISHGYRVLRALKGAPE